MNNFAGPPNRPAIEVIDVGAPRVVEAPPRWGTGRQFWLALGLFLLTVITTLAAGSEFAISYAHNQYPFSSTDNIFAPLLLPFRHPSLFLLGIPFSVTLLSILLAHEMGHYVACKYYRMDATYPFFLPSPVLFGTFGALILIRSPFTTRRALFDVGIAGPIAGFLVAVPALAWSVATAKIVPGVASDASIVFGVPTLTQVFIWLFHPHASPNSVLLDPVGRAAWFGLLATALNLLPVWQLDGGHIVYSLASRRHERISIAVSLAMIAMGIYYWHAWVVWGIVVLILSLRFRHPALLDRWEPLDASRKLWAIVALVIFILCFTPWPTNNP
jgi:membrane-associated protease RseP (regulator of RpoE activity)